MKIGIQVLFLIILSARSASAQVYLVHDYFIENELEEVISNAPVINMPDYDFSSIIEEDIKSSNIQPIRFGYAFDINITNTTDGDILI